MSSINDPMFEHRLSALMRGVLDSESGPHPAWADSAAARRIANGEGKVRRISRPPLRFLALAAALVVGGVAAAGAYVRLNETNPLPTAPVPTAPVPTAQASPPVAASGTNGLIAYQSGTEVEVRYPAGEPTIIRGATGHYSCPQFGTDGLLAYRYAEPLEENPTSWNIEVTRLRLEDSIYDQVNSFTINERPDGDEACFEWSPDGERYAYTTLLGNDVVFTIAEPSRSVSPITVARDNAPPVPDLARWKPDASEVAFVASVDPSGDGTDMYSTIYLAPVDGPGSRALLQTDPNDLVNDVAWSPDGKTIAYRGTRFTDGDPSGAFVKVVTLGPVEQSIQLDELNDPEMTTGAGPAWSPEGTQLAWVLGGELRVGASDGTGWQGKPPVSSDELGTGWATDPVIWSADGGQILVGQIDAPSLEPGVQSTVVMYEAGSNAQPDQVLPWRDESYGRVTWQVIPE